MNSSMIITSNTTLQEVYDYEPLKGTGPYLTGCSDHNYVLHVINEDSIGKMHENVPAWSEQDMCKGLQRLIDVAESGIPFFFNVYTDAEIALDPQKEDVKLFYLPAIGVKTKKYVLLTSGGAYRSVCNIQEGFPVASRMNELGVSVFCLDYRTWSPEMKKTGASFYAMEDVAAALRFIDSHAETFGIEAGKYAMGGFSAGGHVCGMWGTKEMGYQARGAQKPEMLFLNYAFVTTESVKELPPEGLDHFKFMIGDPIRKEAVEAVDIICKVDADYPSCVVVQTEDDEQVPFLNWILMTKALMNQSIPYLPICGKTGHHGYGLGSGSEVAGWVDQAIEYWLQTE